MSVELTTELEVIKHKLAEWLMQKGYIPEFTYIGLNEDGEIYIELEAKGLTNMEKAIYLSREAEKFLNNDDVIVAIYPEEEGTEKN